MSPPNISVIVPVWNVEPYIEQCIESLRAQTLQDMEFIFIDDCGQDGSMVVVERHAAQDGRIRILRNQENLGPGPSRNAGIEVARGEYLGFCDPDDWVDTGFYEELYRAALTEHYDIVKGVRVRATEGGDNLKDRHMANMANQRVARLLAKGVPLVDSTFRQHQSAVYARSLIMDFGVRNGQTSHGEDVVFLVQALCNAKSCHVLESPAHIYHYRQRAESVAHRFDKKHYDEELQATHEQLAYISGHYANGVSGYLFCLQRIIDLLSLHNRMNRDKELEQLAPDYLTDIRELALTLHNPHLLWRQGTIGQSILIFFLLIFGINLYPVAVRKGKIFNFFKQYLSFL